ncbi:ribosomal protein L7/L12, putative [Plasmodium gallinaceum]|uniref:Ribosomal protein L7/L12, putative n=1 Tax=Plasmodium gallinaceum TaxID=5849 RepID=A0A1J1GPH3_PLAGA|nr:ribosomal protein L7/L12, putative [Plasmodium gallinaceum]CRG94325.1 ribosomal protein L7/L12, putative [Plasmodium gallinaceum]
MKKYKFLLKRYLSNFYDFRNISYNNFNRNGITNKFLLKRYFSNFDVFDKIKDVNNSNNNEVTSELKRKPSKKVVKLVDEILNLTLIEAADLCDLCQEKLEGNKSFNNSLFMNRNPFPHPSHFFNAGHFSPLNQNNINNTPTNNNVKNSNSVEEKESKEEKQNENKKITKSTYNIKLEKFDVKNKINTIKEIRKLTNVGLKEAKDMVESAPFYIQKNVPVEKADEIKKKFEELGATIILE